MRELKLTAVGSSPLIADEIKSITQSFLGEEIFITTKTTREVADVEENNFYICAKTQENVLREKIPINKLFVFDLHPTTKFFLDIAKIPADENVFVFNNRLPYTKLIEEECKSLGITSLKFFPIAYDDMPHEEILKRLQKADYIIGIECLTGEQMLLSKKYRPYLKANVIIISGKRAASVSSASKLLAAIAEFYQVELLTEKNSRDSIKIGEKIIRILKNASAKAVIGQIGGASHFADNLTDNLTDIDEQISVLKYLHEKFLRLISPQARLECLRG